ncbi:MATE family efflux transporter [Sinanaerobacter sp. ZZT-01]|uniref:MATE family efflux transporter n=1 Tax=Sinanaerobacter sp. ZZT-01 TaxID=3111540 RepID=UPI002D79CE00|nr:MATE family efflux transporter [Sinanaerobacter sp. ZZT-01]WRR93788.1 MATE family efflux transporter [Sinanaerobacter sp. ZZT-01]
MNKEERITMLREAPIPQLLLKMGLPTMIGMLVTGIYNLVDAYFVGGLGTSQMGAISIAFPLGQAIVGIAVMFGGGAAAYISRLLGERKNEEASHVASTALYLSLSVGTVVIIFLLCFLDKVIWGLGATETIFPYVKQYAMIYVASSIFNIFNVTMNNIASSEGAVKVSMTAMILGAGLNVILDPVCIYGLHMGMIGAASATAVAQIITSIMYLSYIAKKKSIFNFSPKEIRFESKIFREIFKIGIAVLVFQLSTSVAISLTNMTAQPYGDAAIAAMGIVTRVITMGIYAVFGFAKGFQPVAGYNYGARQYERLQSATKIAVKWTTFFCILMTLFMILLPQPVISLFTTNDASVIKIGSLALRINIITFTFYGMEAIYSMLSLALGKALGGWVLSAGRQAVFFIPVILILPKFMGLNGVIAAQPVADIITIIIMGILAAKLNGEIKQKACTFVGRDDPSCCLYKTLRD